MPFGSEMKSKNAMIGSPNPESTRSCEITVRPALYREAGAINRLIRNSMKTYCSLSGVSEEHLDSLKESIGDIVESIKEGIVLVAVDSASKVVGTVRLFFHGPEHFPDATILKTDDRLRDRNILYIARFAVNQKERGRGIGSLLIEQAENIARSENIPLIFLHTSLWNEAVSGFYQNRGYSIDSIDLTRGYPRALYFKMPFHETP